MNNLKIIMINKELEVTEEFNPLFSRSYNEGINSIMIEISGPILYLSNLQKEIKAENIRKILFAGEDILLKKDEDILTMTSNISPIGELTKHLTIKDNRNKLNISIVFSNITGE